MKAAFQYRSLVKERDVSRSEPDCRRRHGDRRIDHDGVDDGVDRRAITSPRRSPEEGLRYKLKARARTTKHSGWLSEKT